MTALMDLEQIRESNPLPSVVGGVIKLHRAGNEWKGCCPFHADKSPSFAIYDAGRKWICFAGCGGGDVFDFVSRLHGIGLRDAAVMLGQGDILTTEIAPLPPADDSGERVEEARTIWRNAVPAQSTLAETYLRWRSLSLPIPPTIRFTSLRYGKRGREYPCLIAAVSGEDGKLCGIQRTYLADDGRGKADVPKAKLSLGRVRCGAIRLAPVARKLVVTEGLEDGLSLQEALGLSVWVACGAGFLPGMRLPEYVRDVAIGGDNDAAGKEAAEKAARAFAERGHGVRVFYPTAPHKDFNDELRGCRA